MPNNPYYVRPNLRPRPFTKGPTIDLPGTDPVDDAINDLIGNTFVPESDPGGGFGGAGDFGDLGLASGNVAGIDKDAASDKGFGEVFSEFAGILTGTHPDFNENFSRDLGRFGKGIGALLSGNEQKQWDLVREIDKEDRARAKEQQAAKMTAAEPVVDVSDPHYKTSPTQPASASTTARARAGVTTGLTQREALRATRLAEEEDDYNYARNIEREARARSAAESKSRALNPPTVELDSRFDDMDSSALSFNSLDRQAEKAQMDNYKAKINAIIAARNTGVTGTGRTNAKDNYGDFYGDFGVSGDASIGAPSISSSVAVGPSGYEGISDVPYAQGGMIRSPNPQGIGYAEGGMMAPPLPPEEEAMMMEQGPPPPEGPPLDGPVGMLNGPGGPKDDAIPMEAPKGSFVINAKAVKKVGLKKLKDLTTKAIEDMGIDTEQLVQSSKEMGINVSNGEYMVPPVIVEYYGEEFFEKLNDKGLPEGKKSTDKPQKDSKNFQLGGGLIPDTDKGGTRFRDEPNTDKAMEGAAQLKEKMKIQELYNETTDPETREAIEKAYPFVLEDRESFLAPNPTKRGEK